MERVILLLTHNISSRTVFYCLDCSSLRAYVNRLTYASILACQSLLHMYMEAIHSHQTVSLSDPERTTDSLALCARINCAVGHVQLLFPSTPSLGPIELCRLCPFLSSHHHKEGEHIFQRSGSLSTTSIVGNAQRCAKRDSLASMTVMAMPSE